MKWFYLIILIFLLSACTALNQNSQTGVLPVTDIKSFDGIFKNSTDTQHVYTSLWNQLNLSNNNTLTKTGSVVMLKGITDRSIKATLVLNDVEQASIILKGKLKNHYFVSKHQRTMIPIPLLYGKFKNQQFQLAIKDDHTLSVDRLNNQWGWVFLFLASNNQTDHNEYKQIKK